MPAMLSIRLLRAPHIAYSDHPVAISRRKSRALLYYLAAHPAPLTRDHLLAFFWPDADRQAAKQNLRTTLYGLRKIFAEQLAVNEDTLALDTTATIDTRLFSAQLDLPTSELTELQATLDLYQGDFLNGFTLPDLPEFDDWATLQRAHYRRLMVTGLARLGQRYEEQQAYLARQFSALERIAGLTANLGLVAQQRGDQTLAVEWLTEALAEAVNIRFLVTQIRLWLAALLPPPLARPQIATARLVAEQDGYQPLLAKVLISGL
ncbi:MAG: hypothetical protein NT075_28350 [Chloroflexi bacterium]|nr:hypothetical protein [Chloroflexota bacterium]